MRWLTLIPLVMLAGCSQLQQDADDAAARVADHVLPGALTDGIPRDGAQTPEERRAAAELWLADPGSPSTTGQGGAVWEMSGSKGTTIRVDVYQYLESGSLFPPDQGEAAWGVACRSYDVAEAVVTSAVVECPEETPEEP